jgi:hypothetical protein
VQARRRNICPAGLAVASATPRARRGGRYVLADLHGRLTRRVLVHWLGFDRLGDGAVGGIRAGERECVRQRERERESVCVTEKKCVCVCVCVCVCERERERERERESTAG